MNVFILCTGRCGSTTIIKACKHITNYSNGHETLSRNVGTGRLAYPINHIEADNRLSWFLGELESKYGDSPYYVHLIREKNATVNSFNKRWSGKVSIIKAFCEGLLMKPITGLSEEERLEICEYYYDTVNKNISNFLVNKSKTLTIYLESMAEGFETLWNEIGAEGDFDKALGELKVNYNSSIK